MTNSKKVKEIKKCIEVISNADYYKQIKPYLAEAITYINELESENERLRNAHVDNLEAYKDGFNEGAGLKKRVDDKLKTENQRLKDRIAELEKHANKLTDLGIEIKKEALKQFAERLKEKLEENSPIAGYDLEDLEFDGETIQDCIDETLKEFLDEYGN